MKDKNREVGDDEVFGGYDKNEESYRASEVERAMLDKQADIDSLRAELEAAEARSQPAPAGYDELRALAATIRTAQRQGHPDAAKHVETLLRKLGA